MTSSKNSFKLLYLLNQRFPTEKAYGIQIVKMCEAFSKAGAEVRLIFPFRMNKVKANPFIYYRVDEVFKVKKLFSPDFYLPGALDKISFFIKNLVSSLILIIYTLFDKTDIIYSRDELPIYFLSFFKKNLVFECHKFSKSKIFFYKRFRNKNIKIITISVYLKNILVQLGFRPGNIKISPDGVDLDKFNIKESQEECRKKVGLPKDKKIIGYVGQLRTMGMEKGIEDLAEAFQLLRVKYKNLILVIVGGREDDINFYKKIINENNINQNEIVFVGHQPYQEIPFYLKSFDILVMPFPKNEHYAFYMSPLKLFEYMASLRPIVATDLPTVREILNENNSILVKPSSFDELTKGIMKVLNDQSLAGKISSKAFEDVKKYTWQKRAGKILEFIK